MLPERAKQTLPAVVVEYDSRGIRKSKRFDCLYAARRFYESKFKENKNPKVKKGEES
jgi:hypothetical protein